jgi:hypothetical protein
MITLLVTNSCALFQPQSDDFSDDPVARAALGLRDPYSRAPASLSSSGNDDLDGSMQRERIAPTFNRLTLGMAMPQVIELWGKPSEVQTAGDANDGNQRWYYSEGVAGLYGLGSHRIVYFEQGRVAGWESH